jgi:hypothetical protein
MATETNQIKLYLNSKFLLAVSGKFFCLSFCPRSMFFFVERGIITPFRKAMAKGFAKRRFVLLQLLFLCCRVTGLGEFLIIGR